MFYSVKFTQQIDVESGHLVEISAPEAITVQYRSQELKKKHL